MEPSEPDTFVCRASESIEIRRLRLEDAPRLENLRQNYTSHHDEWLYMGTAEEFIQASLERVASCEGFWVAVWVDGDMAGIVGLKYMNPRSRTAEIDYMLGVVYRGKGVMTRAVRALVDYAFSQLHLNRVEINVDAANTASCAIPERLGFIMEGTLRQKLSYGTDFGDQRVYAMLAQDWPLSG